MFLCFVAKLIRLSQTVLCVCAIGVYFAFLLVYMCSDTGKRGGPGKAPDTAVSVSLQGDRTAGDGQDSLSPGLCGPQHHGMAPSASLELKMSNVALLN